MNCLFPESFQEAAQDPDRQSLEGLHTKPPLKSLMEEEVLSHFDEYQLNYVNELQNNLSRNEMSIEEKVEAIKNRVAKIRHNTGV